MASVKTEVPEAPKAKEGDPVAQLVNDTARRAVADAVEQAVRTEIENSMKKIDDGLTALERLNRAGRGSTPEAYDLEIGINHEAREVATLIKTFERHIGVEEANGFIDGMNQMIRTGAVRIYGTEEGHVHWHDLNDVHNIKDHIREETLQPGHVVVVSVLDNVEAKIGELLTTSLERMGVDRDSLDTRLLAIREAQRDARRRRRISGYIEPPTEELHTQLLQLGRGEESGEAPALPRAAPQRLLPSGKQPKLLMPGKGESAEAGKKVVVGNGAIGYEFDYHGAKVELDRLMGPDAIKDGGYTEIYLRASNGSVFRLSSDGKMTGPNKKNMDMNLDPELLKGKSIVVGEEFKAEGHLEGNGRPSIMIPNVAEVVAVRNGAARFQPTASLPRNGIIDDYQRGRGTTA